MDGHVETLFFSFSPRGLTLFASKTSYLPLKPIHTEHLVILSLAQRLGHDQTLLFLHLILRYGAKMMKPNRPSYRGLYSRLFQLIKKIVSS